MKKNKICVIGLGYVGLPLAFNLSKYFEVIGFDKNKERILDLKKNIDKTNEIKISELKKAKILFTSRPLDIFNSNIYIVTVPTPIDSRNKPQLTSLISVTKTIASNIKNNDLIIYESTVFPGCTEEILIPLIERISKKKLNKNFQIGYSPERIDPGVSKYKLSNQTKVISGSSNQAVKNIKAIYKKIIKKDIFVAENIKVAEAAKIIENTQRDINIAFINEVSMLFHKMKINTNEVLKAAGTKWNFLNFKPGLVGGHCIGVDPYYLKFKALKEGFKTKLVSSGRSVNDFVPKFIFNEINKEVKKKKKYLKNLKILFLGVTFKENCNDFRNSKAITLFKFLKKNNNIDVFDNLVNKNLLFKKEKIKLISNISKKNFYDIIVIAVPHKKIKSFHINFLRKICKKSGIIIDIKSIYSKEQVEWQL
jgi:UDP-N-acetyl-D-galactosamine dehydrogenase